MNWDIFVQNVQYLSGLKEVSPTTACAESGAGVSLLSQLIHKGTKPSVERVQLLAQYLGVTVSELLGEAPPQSGQSSLADTLTLHDSAVVLKPDDFKRLTVAEVDMVLAYRRASPKDRAFVDLALAEYKKGTSSDVG